MAQQFAQVRAMGIGKIIAFVVLILEILSLISSLKVGDVYMMIALAIAIILL